jgi:hypothetical protein
MRILILDTYYPSFLSHFYQRHPEFARLSYEAQWRALQDECFGTADFYSSNLKRLGHDAAEVVANSEPLQLQWLREHGIEPGRRRGLLSRVRGRGRNEWFETALSAQIRDYQPDVFYVQDMNCLSPAFIKEMKAFAKIVVGQIACPIVPGVSFREYDLVLSSFPHFVTKFRAEGLKSEYFNLGFEPRILDRLTNGSPRYATVFVGSLLASHSSRINFLERVASKVPVETWGPGVDTLSPNSPLREKYHGEAWALGMYDVLHSADIVLNHHIDLAQSYANNMRLYETTGVGSLLVTDWKENLADLFEPGREVVAYRNPDECAEMIAYYLEHEDERKQIAQAGQQRTMRAHTYYHRMQELIGILERYL